MDPSKKSYVTIAALDLTEDTSLLLNPHLLHRLAGSVVTILSKSPRKCTVTGIDQHQINGLDIVQCAVLVNTNHGYVNLIRDEYAYYGKGHTIYSSGQIEWHKNLVDNKSVKVGGTECITTLDSYAFP